MAAVTKGCRRGLCNTLYCGVAMCAGAGPQLDQESSLSEPEPQGSGDPRGAPRPHLIDKSLGRGVSDPVEYFLHCRDADQKDRSHSGGQ